MKLSIVIVNYNVKYFLEQCLQAAIIACKNIDSEIFVVDNNSVDGSTEMIKEKFPNVHLIENTDNPGFSIANNQAIRIAKGKYVLLLNPDTVVEHDTFQKTISFMDEHPEAGGLGVKMVDGKGHFLPESKRGLPTPAVAFYKIFGLSKLFPKSKTFAQYHLGHLDKDEIHEVDILAGAFMLMRKETLDKVGLLDETFFMFGEDIDLSYRITKGGYKNYYFPEARIIHYKGESTKKGSLNYVFVFYNAMIIFVKKHFSQKNAQLFSFLIHMAIWFRAGLAIAQRFIKKAIVPITDAAILYGGIQIIKNYWQQLNNFGPDYYPDGFSYIALPAYISIWLLSMFFSGAYDKPLRLNNIFKGIGIGTIIILVIYALLPVNLRFSRALILLGTVWGMLSLSGIRYFLSTLGLKNFKINGEAARRFAIVGERDEVLRVNSLLSKTMISPGFTAFVGMTDEDARDEAFTGNFSQLKEIIKIFKIDEVIFCAKSIPAQEIINQMGILQELNIDYKIAPQESLSIIGSNSINTSGDMYVIDVNSISKSSNKRTKRLLDISFSVLFMAFSPILAIYTLKPYSLFRNIFGVLSGKRSWVGYASSNQGDSGLPRIRKGILTPIDILKNKDLNDATIHRLNILYSKDYKIKNDLNIIWNGIASLARKSF